jgi:hypothetical protein
MIKSNVRLRWDECDGMHITALSILASRLSAFPRRMVRCARFRGEAAFHLYCFRVATARHEVGAYGSLSCIPEGVPTGVMVLLAAVIILQTTGAEWIGRCHGDVRRGA